MRLGDLGPVARRIRRQVGYRSHVTLDEFRATLTAAAPPADLAPALTALWHDGRGDWAEAHRVAQDVHDESGARVHAYLHRKEGDLGNASYWYRRAGVERATGSLSDEWQAIVSALLAR
jgi:hypothetical protein